MSRTSKVSPSTALTVSEVPSSATEPLTAMNFAQRPGRAEAEMRHAVEIAPRHDRGEAVDVAADHVAAKLVADPARSARIDLRSPLPQPPSVVTARVSAPTSKASREPLSERLDRDDGQAHAGVGDRGADRDRRRIVGALDASRRARHAASRSITSPTSLTIPVNIGEAPSAAFRESLEILDDHARARGRRARFFARAVFLLSGSTGRIISPFRLHLPHEHFRPSP